jgi:hypothetical protein
MGVPQAGIFALGTASHACLEFGVSVGGRGGDLVETISFFREPRTTMGGVNLLAGFRPELCYTRPSPVRTTSFLRRIGCVGLRKSTWEQQDELVSSPH